MKDVRHDSGDGAGQGDGLSAVLERLDARSREVLTMLWEGLGQVEVARRMGLDLDAVADIRGRALAELRALLAEAEQ